MALTPKQARFVAEYLIDLNAAAAARRAGYSERTADRIGHENLRKPEIAAAVSEAQADRARRTEITQDRVLQELARIGFADIRRVMEWDRESVRFVPSAELGDDAALAIAEVSSETKTFTGDAGTEVTVKLRMKLCDKLGALEKLGKHLGMFKDAPHLNVNVDLEKLSEAQLEHLARGGSLEKLPQ